MREKQVQRKRNHQGEKGGIWGSIGQRRSTGGRGGESRKGGGYTGREKSWAVALNQASRSEEAGGFMGEAGIPAGEDFGEWLSIE